MTTTGVFLLVIAALLIYIYLKKYLTGRSIKSYVPEEVEAKIKNNEIILLDVRTPKERKENHIKGSYHIPLYEIKSRIHELNRFKDKEIICYCRVGNRSLIAASKLKRYGFKSANLKGGIVGWKKRKTI